MLSILQVGKHGLIIEFTDPDYSTRRSATYLPEVAAHEGTLCIICLSPQFSPYFHLYKFRVSEN